MSAMPRVFMFTSDTQDWCIRPCEVLMHKYWPNAEVLIAGFRSPPLPTSFAFQSIGDMRDYPYAKWSDAVIDFLNTVPDEVFIFTMEDFWPVREVDEQAITMLANYMLTHPLVTRIDLTSDREYAGNAVDVESLGRLDLITNPFDTPYRLSLQVGLWRKSAILRYLVRGENPHQVELLGTQRMIAEQAVVYATRQNPVRVLIGVQNGKVAIESTYQVPRPVIRDADLDMMLSMVPNGHA